MTKDKHNLQMSAVIPAYNARDYIRDALDSIHRQSRPVDDIIVVNDGSTDDTAAVVERWSLENGRPIRVVHQNNQGLPAARNSGIEHSRNEWIVLLDADDIMLAHHLAATVEAIAAADAVAVFTDGVSFTDAGHIETTSRSRSQAIRAADRCILAGHYLLNDKLFSSLVPGNYIAPSCLSFNKAAARQIAYFDPNIKFCEDRDFLLRLSRVGAFVFSDTVSVKIRVHDNNISHPRNAIRNNLYACKVLKKIAASAAAMGLSPAEQELVAKILHDTALNCLYSGSRQGIKSYLQISTELHHVDQLKYPIPTRSRNLLRALLSDIRKAFQSP